jgi:UDP-glucuronate decarboxylase
MHPDDGRVVSNFVLQALTGNNITIYGDGSQTRSFCYVEDLIEGLVRMMETGPDTTGPINLGNPMEIPILKLAEKVIEMTRTKTGIIYKPLPENDPVRRRPDTTKAKKILNWEATTPLEAGLKRTITYFSELLQKDI